MIDQARLEHDLEEIRKDLVAVVEAMQSAERPTTEDCGIAFVAAGYSLEIVNRLQLDVITDGLQRPAALAAALKERDEWKAEAYRLADVLPDGKP